MGLKSVVSEGRQIELAIELIRLGARLQVLESETSLSRERLLRLYKEVKGASPPKGMLPFSTDWFITWQPNIHASLFMEIHRYVVVHGDLGGIRATISAYRLYLEHARLQQLEALMSFTRAWTLVRFFDSKLLTSAPCTSCGGNFVVHALDLNKDYVCGLCVPPSRAGKSLKWQRAAA
ncbi:MAG TPA: flagellar transcriptional regulator FlhC [Burkholderiales bacterium]|nr:flagellar transcriptional regulator FlhC [Burkholderiales bacterium]